MSRRMSVLVFAFAAIISWVYYQFAAQPILLWVMDALTTMLKLKVSPLLAALWFAAEVVIMLLPFAVLAVEAVSTRVITPVVWLAPVLAFWLPMIGVALFKLVAVGSAPYYSGVGGALLPSLAIAADIVGVILGCALVLSADHRVLVRLRHK